MISHRLNTDTAFLRCEYVDVVEACLAWCKFSRSQRIGICLKNCLCGTLLSVAVYPVGGLLVGVIVVAVAV